MKKNNEKDKPELSIYNLLAGNDLRSIVKSNEVVEVVTKNPLLFDEVFNGIFHEDKVIRARCADAVEKVTKKFPNYIQKKKKIILKHLTNFSQKEVIWHIALMLGYIKLTPRELTKTFNQLYYWLNMSDSIIVKVACMQTLSVHAVKNKNLFKSVRDEIERQMLLGEPAVKARGRLILKTFYSM